MRLIKYQKVTYKDGKILHRKHNTTLNRFGDIVDNQGEQQEHSDFNVLATYWGCIVNGATEN